MVFPHTPPHTSPHNPSPYLQHGADVNVQDGNSLTPLLRACERGNTEAVVMLLNGGALVELRDTIERTSLHWAASGGHTTLCSTLIHQGLPVDVTDQGGYVLICEDVMVKSHWEVG